VMCLGSFAWRVVIRSGQLVEPHSEAPVDEIDLACDDIHVATGEQRVPDQIPHMHELRFDLKRESAVVVTFGFEVLERLADEAHTYMHAGPCLAIVRERQC